MKICVSIWDFGKTFNKVSVDLWKEFDCNAINGNYLLTWNNS